MLKIAAVTLYKHGLGYFERSGRPQGQSVELAVPRDAMDDVLKSLVVIPGGGATVNGVAFETPDDRNAAAQRQPIAIGETAALSGFITAFAGAAVTVAAGGEELRGRMLGLEHETESHLKRAILVIATADGIVPIPLTAVTGLALDDGRSRDDLTFALDRRRRQDERATLRIDLSASADVEVSYIAPAPAWRVSYRVLIGAEAEAGSCDVYVQGWALFDNTLDEDLDGVQLTLTAGMPVSFRYGLHQPNTPQRPLIVDQERTVDAPLDFDAMPVAAAAPMAHMMAGAPPAHSLKRRSRATADDLEASAPAQASGQERAALFAYVIDSAVSVRRGESGMVPIVSFRARGKRDLIYNANKHASHPAATVRVKAPEAATLERGPAIVIEQGAYGGEAVVPFTVGGADLVIGYAIELGVAVHSETAHREETTKLSFRDRSMFIDVLQYVTTTYEIASQLATPAPVVIEHRRAVNATFDTAPDETLHDLARFRVAVPPRGTARLAVVERTPLRRQQSVTGLNGHALGAYLRDRLLTAETVKTLETIVAREAEIATVEADRKALDADRKAARMRVDDAVKSLGALDATRDAALRPRFVGQLETFDNALQMLDERERALIGRIAALQAEVERAIQTLSTAKPGI